MFLKRDTLDDLVRTVITAIRDEGQHIRPRKGDATEINGVLLELSNPRARLSTTETRGKLFSCLGEFCWYLAKRADLDFMNYYISSYGEHVNVKDGRVIGAYGPRLFGGDGIDQMTRAISNLRANPYSRRSVIVILRENDLDDATNESPCTSTLQMLCRDSKLDMIVSMRSNDVYKGLVHDIYAFTMLQELAAAKLSIDVGTYKHFVGSLHIYNQDDTSVDRFMSEGWQSTTAMPQMPANNVDHSISQFLEAENAIRTGSYNSTLIDSLPTYWADLALVLWAFRCKKDRSLDAMRIARDKISSPVYVPFINEMMDAIERSDRSIPHVAT